MPRSLAAALLALLVAACLAACGSGGSSTDATDSIPPAQAKGMKQTAQAARAAEAHAPAGASPTLRRIYRAFQPPEVAAMDSEAARAVKAGEAACRGKTPLAVKDEFWAAAEENLEPEQARIIRRVRSFEVQERTDGSFVAGQLAADTYAATLPEGVAQAGYQGCVYALAMGLERRLAPGK